MKIKPTQIPDVLLIHPEVHGDARGFLMETYREDAFIQAGLRVNFVQDNHSLSTQGVLRGLHYQIRQPQAKLVRVVAGEIYDVAVDSAPEFSNIWTLGGSQSIRRKQAAIVHTRRDSPTASWCSVPRRRCFTRQVIIMPRNGTGPCCGMTRSLPYPGHSNPGNIPSFPARIQPGNDSPEAETYE